MLEFGSYDHRRAEIALRKWLLDYKYTYIRQHVVHRSLSRARVGRCLCRTLKELDTLSFVKTPEKDNMQNNKNLYLLVKW